jgi:hypothetical protein
VPLPILSGVRAQRLEAGLSHVSFLAPAAVGRMMPGRGAS